MRPYDFIPVPTQNHAHMVEGRQDPKEIVEQAIFTGNMIGREIDPEISQQPPEYDKIQYSRISGIILKHGKDLPVSKLFITTTIGKSEYNLMHSSYEIKRYLDCETLNGYKELITQTAG